MSWELRVRYVMAGAYPSHMRHIPVLLFAILVAAPSQAEEPVDLQITSAIPVEVSINGKWMGTTPVSFHEVLPGTYAIYARGPCVEPWTGSVDVMAGETSVLHVPTVKKTRAILVEAVDAHGREVIAELHAGDRSLGNTPFLARVGVCDSVEWKATAEGLGSAAVTVADGHLDKDVRVVLGEGIETRNPRDCGGMCRTPSWNLEFPDRALLHEIYGTLHVRMLAGPNGGWVKRKDPLCTAWETATPKDRRTMWHRSLCIFAESGDPVFVLPAVEWVAEIRCTQVKGPIWWRIPFHFQGR